MEDESTLVNSTQKMMGGDLNLETFGEKPLRVIEEQEAVQLSDDEDQPNSLKNVTHPNLSIPPGNCKIERTEEIETFREKLPIFMKEQ
jgi:DNA polymerase III epsilon subunit-like protein